MDKTEPSEEAMRAAQRLCDADGNLYGDPSLSDVAEIIDREFAPLRAEAVDAAIDRDSLRRKIVTMEDAGKDYAGAAYAEAAEELLQAADRLFCVFSGQSEHPEEKCKYCAVERAVEKARAAGIRRRQMSDPTVCAICLTRDRPELARRAIECFRTQTYQHKRLLLTYTQMADLPSGKWSHDINVQTVQYLNRSLSIGAIRNMAVKEAEKSGSSDIILHLDDDDYSHPQRIAEQVALLQASGAECVGYREMLFWRTRVMNTPSRMSAQALESGAQSEQLHSEAWLYSVPNNSWAVGASFCYWRKTWEQHRFPDLPRPGVANGSSEDVVWRRGVRCVGVSGLAGECPLAKDLPRVWCEPRLICRIHGGNTQKYEPERYPDTWRRVAGWDKHCREVCG